MALNSLHCTEVPLRNCSLTHSLSCNKKRVKRVKDIKTVEVICIDYGNLAERQGDPK